MKQYLKMIAAVIALLLLAYFVDLRALYDDLSLLTWNSAIYLGLISVLLIYISAMKWGAFLEALGSKVSVIRLFNLYLLGYFVNLILPSYLGGDAVRSWYAGKESGQHQAFAATILERYTGLLAMVSLGLIFVWWVPHVTIEVKLAILVLALGLFGVSVLALSSQALALLARIKLLKKIVSHLSKIQAAFHLARKDCRLLIKVMLLSYLYHVITVVNTVAAAWAVGWYTAPPLELFVVLPIILVIGSLPVSPNGLGLQEGAFVYFLTSVGATSSQAMGVALVLRAKGYAIALIGGLVFLKIRAEKGAPTPGLEDSTAAKIPDHEKPI